MDNIFISEGADHVDIVVRPYMTYVVFGSVLVTGDASYTVTTLDSEDAELTTETVTVGNALNQAFDIYREITPPDGAMRIHIDFTNCVALNLLYVRFENSTVIVVPTEASKLLVATYEKYYNELVLLRSLLVQYQDLGTARNNTTIYMPTRIENIDNNLYMLTKYIRRSLSTLTELNAMIAMYTQEELNV